MLVNNLGADKGTEIYNKWVGGKNFKDNLKKFNDRRQYAHNGDYNNFLKIFYKQTWKNRAQNAYMFISKQNKYSGLFSYQTDFDMLFKIFPEFKKQITF